jgi:glycine betaine transporter
MTKLKHWLQGLLGEVGLVFYLSIVLIGVFLAAAIANPQYVQEQAQNILDATATNFVRITTTVNTCFCVA